MKFAFGWATVALQRLKLAVKGLMLAFRWWKFTIRSLMFVFSGLQFDLKGLKFSLKPGGARSADLRFGVVGCSLALEQELGLEL